MALKKAVALSREKWRDCLHDQSTCDGRTNGTSQANTKTTKCVYKHTLTGAARKKLKEEKLYILFQLHNSSAIPTQTSDQAIPLNTKLSNIHTVQKKSIVHKQQAA